MNEIKIQWHPGFVAAINLELAENRDDLIYEKEYNLNTEPLEIDLLVIKKDKDVQIANEIGRMFKGNNILEYRSPEDRMDIDSFYKAGAYASLYKAYGETVDERKADDITVSLVREAKPDGLFRYFREHKVEVSNPYPGIYYVLDGVLFFTQVIVTRELNGKNHGWLKSLSDKLKKQEMEALLNRARSLSGKLERELADAVLEVSVKANREIVEELKGDEAMCQALLEIMEPEINKIVGLAKEEADQKAKKEAEETAAKLIQSQKFSFEEIHQCVPRLSIEDIQKIAAKLANA
ncbi:MAG: hypothetical protein HFG58_09035 [Lachnospiraceae bacterium]|nr:hypothetical protein [Lachnospiraceae bacterium]